MYFAFIFSEHITITSSEEVFKSVRAKFFSEKNEQRVLLVTYLLNYDSSKSTSFMLNMAFGFVLSTVFVKQIGIYCNTLQRLQKRSSFLSLCFDM